MRHRPRRVPATFQILLFGGVTGAALLCLAGLGACAGGPSSGSTVQIDWVNVVQFGGIQYLATSIPGGGRPQLLTWGPCSPPSSSSLPTTYMTQTTISRTAMLLTSTPGRRSIVS